MTDSQSAQDDLPTDTDRRPRNDPANPYTFMFAEAQRQEREQLRRYEEQNDAADIGDKLRKAQRSFQTKEDFEPGDLVQWKTFMQSNVYPRYGRPAVVVAFDKQAPNGPKPNSDRIFANDLVVGFLDHDGDFVVFGTDSRRWQRWEDTGSGQ